MAKTNKPRIFGQEFDAKAKKQDAEKEVKVSKRVVNQAVKELDRRLKEHLKIHRTTRRDGIHAWLQVIAVIIAIGMATIAIILYSNGGRV